MGSILFTGRSNNAVAVPVFVRMQQAQRFMNKQRVMSCIHTETGTRVLAQTTAGLTSSVLPPLARHIYNLYLYIYSA